MTQNAVTKRSQGGTIEGLLKGDPFRKAVSKALPRHLHPDRFIRVALTAMMRTPKLASCDQKSFFDAMLTLSALGIEPDGRRAHLIPFRNNKRNCNEVQLIIDYKGLVELAMRSGTVSSIHADVVCENDQFEYDRGELKTHKVDFRHPRGEAYAAYALVRFKDGTEKAEVLSREEIEAVRARSKARNSGPWNTDWNEMAKKTVFRRLSKWITLSPEYRDGNAQAGPPVQSAPGGHEAIDIESTLALSDASEVPDEDPPETEPEPPDLDEAAEAEAGLAPHRKGKVKSARKKEENQSDEPNEELAELVTSQGFTFDHFVLWGVESGNLPPAAEDWGSFDEVHHVLAKRFLRSRAGLLQGLQVAKDKAEGKGVAA